MKVKVTCEECGFAHLLERRLDELNGERELHMVCHGCEGLLVVLLNTTVGKGVDVDRLAVWNALFDGGTPVA